MKSETDPIKLELARLRRDQILDAATTVFAAKGFARATTKEIAATAGLAEGTIYNYFGSKADVFVSLMARLNESEHREVDLAPGQAEDPRVFFEVYLRHRIELLWPNVEALRATLPELLINAELRESYRREVLAPTIRLGEQLFESLVAAGKLRTFDVPLVTRSVAGTVVGLLLLGLLGDDEIRARWDELPAAVTALVFDGLLPQKPSKTK